MSEIIVPFRKKEEKQEQQLQQEDNSGSEVVQWMLKEHITLCERLVDSYKTELNNQEKSAIEIKSFIAATKKSKLYTQKMLEISLAFAGKQK